ncbi:HNH endonuclease [Enterococcus cecorum]|uniref:HNH endonuclease n=1 Tax=Enterococcus cecorum TaxID=44008 RepID=UPI00064316E6|nr:HNH endonuclease signature motif containing protein [Enterococcus cecorum]KLO71586.1 HNH endonuclease [Enterococcus cecorum]
MRADRVGKHRTAFEKNRKRILMTENTCGICGQPVDKQLKPPHPLSPVIDHIIPINKGGHPSDINNLQLAHWQCNRAKSDKLFNVKEVKKEIKSTNIIGNRNLPQSIDWMSYRQK